MKTLLDLVEKGGPAMIAIIVLSVVLYSRCFKLLLSLRRCAGTCGVSLVDVRARRRACGTDREAV